MQYISKADLITKSELETLSLKMFGGLLKGVVDVEKRLIAIDAEMHVDLEQELLDQGSDQKDLWGINLYPAEAEEAFLEFDSMINIRPSQGNKTRGVEDEMMRTLIQEIVTESVQL